MIILPRRFFQSKNTIQVAKNLLGKFLARRYRGKTSTYMILEVEAYDGLKDVASHAHRGKTERNKIMFGPAGYWYIYFTYGMHWMLNIVTGPKDYPAAILIRGAISDKLHKILDGPAKITKALKIDKKINGKSANQKTGLWIEDRGVKINSRQIKNSPRVGVGYAGSVWSKKKWRFYII